jgi:hypothetical protein
VAHKRACVVPGRPWAAGGPGECACGSAKSARQVWNWVAPRIRLRNLDVTTAAVKIVIGRGGGKIKDRERSAGRPLLPPPPIAACR